MQNFKTLRQLLLGELAMSPEERGKRERRKKCHAMPPMFMPAAKGSARTALGPTFTLPPITIKFQILDKKKQKFEKVTLKDGRKFFISVYECSYYLQNKIKE
jgi:hypothetical protein